jgi:membrane fusion protein (multidrug efflux system)
VERRAITVDRAVGNQWLVTSGLAAGDRVIVEGLQMLRPGTVVKASPFDESKNGQQQTAESGVKIAKRIAGGK